ncbi:hypothetical protein GQX74_009079 [Glossina fuscipes]|nr:hypothetical protein GQX74_009079 [Glossina fuscipes]
MSGGYSLKMHSLSQHIVSSQRPFACPLENCAYATTTKSLLKIHSASHSTESFHCEHEDCSYVGKSELHMKRHLLSHTPANSENKLYACPKCHFKAKTKNHLERHIRSHTGDKPYPCPYCQFRSSSLENLRKHILKTGKHPDKFMDWLASFLSSISFSLEFTLQLPDEILNVTVPLSVA